MKWGTEIRSAREKSGLTQEDLANKTGLSRNTIINYESGRRVPRGDDIEKIAEACGLKVCLLLNPTTPRQPGAESAAAEPVVAEG